MNTVFIRLEGPLQCWRAGEKYFCRRTHHQPTKSGITGMICACMGLRRKDTGPAIAEINKMKFGVRIDRPGWIIDDYQTAMNSIMANGKQVEDDEESISEILREYIADGSFLVALQGDPQFVEKIGVALQEPQFTAYLGAKCCPPGRKLLEGTGNYNNLEEALASVPWRPRTPEEEPETLSCVVEVEKPGPGVEVCLDVAKSFYPIVHSTRLVKRIEVPVTAGPPLQMPVMVAKASDKNWPKISGERMKIDNYLCVVCQLPADHVHHVTYERAGNEKMEDLRSVCKECHEAITALEYTMDMKTNRIDPCLKKWRAAILDYRDRIVKGN